MEQQELTRDELLKTLPKMDLRTDPRANEGGPISARKAAERVKAYEQFINTPPDSLKGQTFAIGFNTRKLIDWLQQNSDNMSAVQVYLTIDEDQMLNVVFWPYTVDGLPSVLHEGKQDGATLSSPYNIGGRRP